MILEFDDMDRHLRDTIGASIADARAAIKAYEGQNMRDAERDRRASEACENGCQFMGYSPVTLRRIVYCWREGIGFWDDLTSWRIKQHWKQKNQTQREE